MAEEPQPFVNVEYASPETPSTTQEEVRVYASQFFNTLESLNIGRGAKSFKADSSGVWLGGNLFSEATFSVDMLGNVVANSILINGLGGDIIAGALDANGNFVNEIISTNLNTQSKQILGSFTFVGSGALDISTDVNNGLWISPTGILGKKAGATTFAIENDGDATFGGTLVAASGTFGTITAGTFTGVAITGATIQTATTGLRTVLDSNNVRFYSDATLKGFMRPDTGQSIVIGSADDFYFTNLSGVPYFKLNSNGNLEITGSGKKILFGSGRYLDDSPGDGLSINGVFSSNQDNADSLGRSAKRWSNIYATSCRCSDYYSGDGSQGETASDDFVTSVYLSGNDLKYKYKNFAWKDGLLTSHSGSEITGTVGQVIGNG